MANTVDKVINIAKAEIGYLEKKSNSQLDDKTANAGYNNYTKYGRDMHSIYPAVMDFPAAWCDCFVDWCFYKAYGISTAKSLLGGNFDDYTVNSAQLYKNKKAWYSSPKVGDQIFFKNSTRICHTGLVYAVDSTYVYTIEGNTSGASGVIANGGGVCAKKYTLNYSSIAGYGRPKYDETTDTSTNSTTSNTNSNTYTVQKGDTLSKIGTKVGIKWQDIASLNGIKSPYVIHVGQVLNLPSSAKVNAPAVATCNKGKTCLKKGSKGAQVILLQKDLNYVLGCNLEVDGDFGSKTDEQLRAFQKKYGLSVDGSYGLKSEAQMEKVCK